MEARKRVRLISDDLSMHSDDSPGARERTLIDGIMTKMLGTMNITVSHRLAERLTAAGPVSRGICERLALPNREILFSDLPGSPDTLQSVLYETARLRGREHWLALSLKKFGDRAERNAPSADIGNSRRAMNGLLDHVETTVAQAAREYVGDEDRRIGRSAEPLLRVEDLPLWIAAQLFGHVGATLRKEILDNFQVAPEFVDPYLEQATHAAIAANTTAPKSCAEVLANVLFERDFLTEDFLLQALCDGYTSLFLACFSRVTGMDARATQFIILEPDSDALAIVCRAATFDRRTFAYILMLTMAGSIEAKPPAEIAGLAQEKVRFFDDLDVDDANAAAQYWRLSPEYHSAIRQVG